MNDKTKSAPKEAEITIYKCHNCGFKYYEKANYCTQCGHEQQEIPTERRKMAEGKREVKHTCPGMMTNQFIMIKSRASLNYLMTHS